MRLLPATSTVRYRASRCTQHEIHMHCIVRKYHAVLGLLDHACIQQRMNIAMHRLHITSEAARDFADRHRTLAGHRTEDRSEEHTSELQSLMRISYAGF